MKKFDSNTIEYQDLLMFYRDEITLYNYKYFLDDNSIVKLIFKEQHFCKLIALDEFAPSSYKRREYLDDLGLEKINNKLITCELMKKTKPKEWRTYRNRLEYFPYITDLLKKPEYIIFNNKNTKTKIRADVILLYKLSDKEYLHLFCRYIDSDKKNIKPVTFIVHKNEKYIEHQERKVISKIETILVD